jgi:hypothetical protein
MPALITNIIPPDGFELVRDAIGAILLLELQNQKTLQGFSEEVTIYQERIKPIQTDEDLFINVLLDSATYSQYTPKDQQGRTIYFIDICTTGQASTGITGDMDSSTRLHRFMRMCRYILSSDLYDTLGFERRLGLIGGKYVESFATAEPQHKEDSYYTRMGRISFAVRITENQNLATPISLFGNDTTVKLQETEHGYQYVMNSD